MKCNELQTENRGKNTKPRAETQHLNLLSVLDGLSVSFVCVCLFVPVR